MNEFDNGYQEETNEVSETQINEMPQTEYNDTYYNESYSKNYSEYEEPKKEIPWKIIGIIGGAVLFIILLVYFLFFGNKGNGDKEYTELVVNLCNKALEYEKNNEGIIDKNTPGSTAYVSLQRLVDAYLISSEQIKDPRYKASIFGKSEFRQYIPFTSYLRLAVASNGEVYCEGLVDTSEDETAPIITLNGQEEITIAKGTNFTDPGAKAVDDIDGDITDKIVRSGTVDTTKVGEYTIIYRATDAKGNSTTMERKIIVKEYKDLEETIAINIDSITPQIEIKGSNPYCLKLGEKYVEPGVIAIDNVDGDITNRIIVENKITGERLGPFRVTYRVEDNAGNTAIAYRSVEVKTECSAAVPPTDNTKVNTKPVISLSGGTVVVWPKGEPYADRGATAWDKEDGDLTTKIKIDSSAVNVNVGGIYTVYYEVTDSKGLKGVAERKVTVKDSDIASNVARFDSIPPSLRIALGHPQAIETPTAKDSNGVTLQVTVTITDSSGAVVPEIDFYKAGVYKITYTAKPTNGVSQSISRTVTVYDTEVPTLSVPTEISIKDRNTNCNVTQEDLFNAGVTVSDGTNTIKPNLVISGGENKACAVNTTGFNIKVYAIDNDGNKSEEKTIKVKIIESGVTTPDNTAVTNVVIGNCGTNNETKMYVGGKLQLSNIVYPTNAVNKEVTWTTNNNAIATVENGLVTAVGKGMVDVRVRTVDEGKEAICTIIVEEPVQTVGVESVEINGCETGTITILKGAGLTFTSIVKPATATNKKVTWSSSNSNVATIESSGVLKGINVGSSTITVTTEDGNKSKTCTVNVVASTVNDTTAPSKVVVKSNNANPADPYNTNGTWYGGAGKKEIKLTVESNDTESGISKFQVLNSKGEILKEFYPFTQTPNSGELVWTDDINETVTIRAVNGAGLVGPVSENITLKLDNTGPTTTFSTWIEDPNKWINKSEYTIKYKAIDIGVGVESYQYTHDDVKTKKAEDIKIEGTTNEVEMKFLESSAREYVYVRAVDKLGNIGPWTAKPSYLNMDTVAPQAPTISVLNNNTSKVTVGFGFTDSSSPRMSGFGKYEYKLNGGKINTITTENGTFELSTAGKYNVEAWSYDKAGNKSANSTVKNDIVVTKPSNTSGGNEQSNQSPTSTKLTIACPKGIKKGEVVTITSNLEVKNWIVPENIATKSKEQSKSLDIQVHQSPASYVLHIVAQTADKKEDSCDITIYKRNISLSCKKGGIGVTEGSEIRVGEEVVCNVNPSSGITLKCDGAVNSSTSSSIKCSPTKEGTLTVTASDSEQPENEVSIKFDVSPVVQSGISLGNCKNKKMYMFVEDTINIGAAKTGDTNDQISYVPQSGSSTYITLTNGNVYAKKEGTAYVDIILGNNIKETCEIVIVGDKSCSVEPIGCADGYELKKYMYASGLNTLSAYKCFVKIDPIPYEGCSSGTKYKNGSKWECGTGVSKVCPTVPGEQYNMSCDSSGNCICRNKEDRDDTVTPVCPGGTTKYNDNCYKKLRDLETLYKCENEKDYEYNKTTKKCVSKKPETAKYVYQCPKNRTYNGSGCELSIESLKKQCTNG